MFPLPHLEQEPRPAIKSRSRRVAARMALTRRAVEMANRTIDALNSLFSSRPAARPTRRRKPGPKMAAVLSYILMCSREFCAAPRGGAENQSDGTELFDYDKLDAGAPVPLRASLISLPESVGSFDFSGYLGPQLEPWATGRSSARRDPLVASLLAKQTRSCQMVETSEYPKIIARLSEANILSSRHMLLSVPWACSACGRQLEK